MSVEVSLNHERVLATDCGTLWPMLRMCTRFLLPSLTFSALLVQAPAAQQTRLVVDVSKLGPQIGQPVPDFSLKDQNSKVWTRQSIMGPKGAMLVFIRSADW